jgi:hypothetical protein
MVFDAIKKGFAVAGKTMGLVLILIAFNLIWNVVSIPLAVAPGTTPSPQVSTMVILLSVVFILISIFMQGATLGIIRDYLKEGKQGINNLVGYGIKYYLRLLLLGLLIILVIAIVALIAGLIVALTAPLNNRIITMVAVIIDIAIGVVLGLKYFLPFMLSPYSIVCEETGVIGSLKRSLDVCGKSIQKTLSLLLLLVLLILISLGIGFVVGFIIGLLAAIVPQASGRVIMAMVTGVINGYLGVVMMASLMAFYLDLTAGGKARA